MSTWTINCPTTHFIQANVDILLTTHPPILVYLVIELLLASVHSNLCPKISFDLPFVVEAVEVCTVVDPSSLTQKIENN